MAGLYIILNGAGSTRLNQAADYLRFSDEAEVRFEDDIACVWLGHDDPNLFGPANDPESGVQVFAAGRTVWDEADLQSAETSSFEGGLCNRVLLDRYLRHGSEAVDRFSGAAIVCIWDPRQSELHLWTDLFGYHPAFLYRSDEIENCVISTFPDAIAADPDTNVSPDLVSMAEFLRAWRVTPPHSYYNEVKYAGAATHWSWSKATGKVRQRIVWRPFEDEPFRSLDEASNALSDAVLRAIRSRTGERVGNIASFVSGGADSRVLLYAADEPSRVTGVNLYDQPNQEAKIARALCDRIGVNYLGFGRDRDYYPRLMHDIVRWSGGMWCIEDSHYLGTTKLLNELSPGLVMTACTTDWLFKGYGLEKQHRQLIGRNLPIKMFSNTRVDGFLPNYPLPSPPELSDAVHSRLDDWFQGCPRNLQSDRDRLITEDRRVRPACYTVSVSGQMMYRIFPYDSFLADDRIAECYSRTQARWKLNGDVWERAAARICRDASDIVDSNFGWRLGASTSQKLVAFARGWISRRIRKQRPANVNPNSPAQTNSSWPNFGWYIQRSATLRGFWNSVPADHRDRLALVWGTDPWATTLDDWSRRPNEFFRMLTLLNHWALQDSTE